jgi:hypothetical protein
MSHWYYFLVGALVGSVLSMIGTYLLVCGHYARKEQQKKLIRFIRAMRKLYKSGNIDQVEIALLEFAKKCMNFQVDTFDAFKNKEIRGIGSLLNQYVYQGVLYHNDNETLSSVSAVKTWVSQETTVQEICNHLRNAIIK